MHRRLLAWCLTVPLAVVGSQAAHWLAYRLAVPNGEERARVMASTGHSYLAWAPAVVAVCTVLAACAFVGQVRALTRGRRGAAAPAPWMLASLGPTIFCFQEWFERLASEDSLSWNAVTERTFIFGLLLQFPVAMAAYAAARLILRAATRVASLLARGLVVSARPAGLCFPSAFLLAAPLGIVALGYPTRGPPLHQL
jgi:hypothetical protein